MVLVGAVYGAYSGDWIQKSPLDGGSCFVLVPSAVLLGIVENDASLRRQGVMLRCPVLGCHLAWQPPASESARAVRYLKASMKIPVVHCLDPVPLGAGGQDCHCFGVCFVQNDLLCAVLPPLSLSRASGALFLLGSQP